MEKTSLPQVWFANLRAVVKFILFLTVCLVYALHALVCHLLKKNDQIPHIVKFYCSIHLWVLGISIKQSFQVQKGEKTQHQYNPNDNSNAQHMGHMGRFIVSNHMSYLDIIVISMLYPCYFITSNEVKEMPFLGQLTVLASCIFVERRDKKNIDREINHIAQELRSGKTVAIFPEATSTNGAKVLDFKKPLFNAAIKAECPVQPITINYCHINKMPVNETNRDLLCWYGDMDFLPHFFKLLKLQSIEMEAVIHPVVEVSRVELAHKISKNSLNSLNSLISTASTTTGSTTTASTKDGLPLEWQMSEYLALKLHKTIEQSFCTLGPVTSELTTTSMTTTTSTNKTTNNPKAGEGRV